jgi:hypothetical protein
MIVFEKNKSMSDGNYRGELSPEITKISEKKRTQLPLINTASRPGISLLAQLNPARLFNRGALCLPRSRGRLKYLVSKSGVFFTRMAVARPVSVC